MRHRIRIEVYPISPIQIIHDYLSYLSDHNLKLKARIKKDLLYKVEAFWTYSRMDDSDKKLSEIELLILKIQAEQRKSQSILREIASQKVNKVTELESNVIEPKKCIIFESEYNEFRFIEELKNQKLTLAMLEEVMVILLGIEASTFLFYQKIYDLAKYQKTLRKIHDLAQTMIDALYQIRRQTLNPSINDPTDDFYLQKSRSENIEIVPIPDDSSDNGDNDSYDANDQSDALESIFAL
jgi:ribosomal protein L22